MQDSYRARYFKLPEGGGHSKKFTVYSNKQISFQNSGFSNNMPKENYNFDHTLMPENCFRTSRNDKETKHLTCDDEFSTFGTSRLIKTSTAKQILMDPIDHNNIESKTQLSRISKEKDLRVKFSDEYTSTVDNSMDSQDYAKISKEENESPEDPALNVEVKSTFSNLFSDYNNPTGNIENDLSGGKIWNDQSEKFNLLSNSGNDGENPTDKENVLNLIKKYEQKVKSYTNKLKILKSQAGIEYEQEETIEEMEVEEMEEITTKTTPIFNETYFETNRNLQWGDPILQHYEHKSFEYDSFESERLQILEEILQENERKLKTELMVLQMEHEPSKVRQVLTEENNNVSENNEVNDNEFFKEWFSEHDQTYSVEQRNLMETIYETFQTNQTQFVQLIAQLLSKDVKSVAIQKDPVETNDKFTFTNETNLKNVHCGESNSVNVAIIELSRLKNVSVQVGPLMTSKFTCPLARSKSDQCTNTLGLIKTISIEILHLPSLKGVTTQTSKGIIEDLPVNVVSKRNFPIEIPVRYKTSDGAYTTEEIKTKLASKRIIPSPVSSINHYLMTRNENKVNNLKKFISSRSDDKFARTRVESYGIQNYRSRNNFNSIGRKRNSLRWQPKEYYEPISLTDTNNGHLNHFNTFMRSTILQGYTDSSVNLNPIPLDKFNESSSISNPSSNHETHCDDPEVRDEHEIFD